MTASIPGVTIPRGLLLATWLCSSAESLCDGVCGTLTSNRAAALWSSGPFPSCSTQRSSRTMVEPHYESYRVAWSDDRTARASHAADGR